AGDPGSGHKVLQQFGHLDCLLVRRQKLTTPTGNVKHYTAYHRSTEIGGVMDQTGAGAKAAAVEDAADDARDGFLVAVGELVRSLRARTGMTRRALSVASEVSERHLPNLDLGVGNASILVLRQIAHALDCELGELLGHETAASP